MGRQTKKQRERKAAQKRTVTTPSGTEVVQPRKQRSQMPGTAKAGYRPPVEHKEIRKNPQVNSTVADGLKHFLGGMKGKSATSPEQREQASHRLKVVSDMLRAHPAPILEQLKQVGVPIAVVHNVRGNPEYDTVVIKVADLQAADARIAKQGTLYEQIWKASEQ